MKNKKIQISVNGVYQYTTADTSIKSAIAHLRQNPVTIASLINKTLIVTPNDKITGRIIGNI